MTNASRPFHIVAKPIGPLCNMTCSYCFYSEKRAYYPDAHKMSDKILEQFIKSYIAAQPGREVNFLWQGGEPLLAGLDYYRKALFLQKKHGAGKRISNAIQTNGTLLNEEWCRFLHANHFLVGISLDGPEEVHNAYRRMRSGKPSFPDVLRGVRLLQQYHVEFNVTCCVSNLSAENPLKVYHFLKELGVQYLQFAPIVERLPSNQERSSGQKHASPDAVESPMIPGSVGSSAYGSFLSTIFDEWIVKDIGHIYIMNFEWALSAWMGLPVGYCIFAEDCGNALALEHNGDIYSCDHFVYDAYRLGNLDEDSLCHLLDSEKQILFRSRKRALPQKCLECEYSFACHGECPKNRFLPNGENYLCRGYYEFFSHIAPDMNRMVQLIKSGHEAFEIRKEK